MKKVETDITGQQFPLDQLYKGSHIRSEVVGIIQKEYPGFQEDSYINSKHLNDFRKKYLEQLIAKEFGDLNSMESQVVLAIRNDELISRFPDEKFLERLPFGQKIADKVASFGGSWPFIMLFFFLLACWMILNSSYFFFSTPFDPFPFILLNLILSCLAAIQAPIIMMSQNRKEAKDRLRAESDYKINLKAELEIKLLHEKMDHLLVKQNQYLIRIQEIQTDYLEDILNRINSK